MSVELTIVEQMVEVAREHAKPLAQLSPELVLADSGLDSLGFAVLVVRLEEKLGVNPFKPQKKALFPVTLGEFVKMYESDTV